MILITWSREEKALASNFVFCFLSHATCPFVFFTLKEQVSKQGSLPADCQPFLIIWWPAMVLGEEIREVVSLWASQSKSSREVRNTGVVLFGHPGLTVGCHLQNKACKASAEAAQSRKLSSIHLVFSYFFSIRKWISTFEGRKQNQQDPKALCAPDHPILSYSTGWILQTCCLWLWGGLEGGGRVTGWG